MQTTVQAFFERYQRVFKNALLNEPDLDEVAQLYAAEFIASTPAGVMTGKNDERLKQVMQQGYGRYRELGMVDMQLVALRVSPVDEEHCVAHVSWRATYAREARPDIAIDFDVHYFLRGLMSEPRVFGWVSGDEEVALKEHGLA